MGDTRYRYGASEQASVVDEGLRSYMLGVYNHMALGVAWTALVTLLMLNAPSLMVNVAIGPLKWVVFFGLLGLGFLAPRIILSGNTGMAYGAYGLYATLWGVLLSPMILFYLQQSPELIVRALGLSALLFASMSLVGYTTKRDLSGFGGFFMMASIGLLLVMLANVFVFEGSTTSQIVISGLVVLLFSGVTAYETQGIKALYYAGDGLATARGKSIFGAFMLYGSFVTLFVHILNILGLMRSSQ